MLRSFFPYYNPERTKLFSPLCITLLTIFNVLSFLLNICFLSFFIAIVSIMHFLHKYVCFHSFKVHIFWIFAKSSPYFCPNVVPVKSKGKISQNFVAFSEYMNFISVYVVWKKLKLDLKFAYKFNTFLKNSYLHSY